MLDTFVIVARLHPKFSAKFYVYISGAYKGCLFYYSAKNRQMVQELTFQYMKPKGESEGRTIYESSTATLNVSCYLTGRFPTVSYTLVHACANCRISVFEMRFHETETSYNGVGSVKRSGVHFSIIN